MHFHPNEPWRTACALGAATAGAWLGWRLGFPAPVLTGPAFFVALLGLLGAKLDLAQPVRQGAFVVIGIGIGGTVDHTLADLLLRWPLAFAALAVLMVVIMWLSVGLLTRLFGFDRRSAVLASAPGHLSFVISLGTQMKVDLMRITVVQSVRLLCLTLAVPLLARLFGIDIPAQLLAQSQTLSWGGFAVLLAISVPAGLALLALRVPAAMLVGAMSVSALAHATGYSQGGLDPWVAAAGVTVLGALIGTRFGGIGWRNLTQSLAAGLCMTTLVAVLSALAALALAAALEIPRASALAAFAPGGFETMIAIGAAIGGSAGFIAAAHVARLLILTALIPLFLRGARPRQPRA